MDGIMNTTGVSVESVTCSVCRANAEAIEAEANNLMTRLKNAQNEVSSSSEDIKEQYLSIIQVRHFSPPTNDLCQTCFPHVLCDFRTVWGRGSSFSRWCAQ